MRNLFFIILVLFISSSIISCTAENGEDNRKSTLEVYNAIFSNDEYVIEETPMFTINDIESYDWKTHQITLKSEYIDYLNELYMNESGNELGVHIGGIERFNTNFMDKFMLYIDEELIYSGHYEQSLYSSYAVMGIVMTSTSDGVIIEYGMNSEEDHRNDPRVYEVLESYGVLVE
jgi:hypothetical protein